MKRFFLSLAVLFSLIVGQLPLQAQAQANFWIQVESHPNLRDTKTRAQFYAAQFGETQAYRTNTSWNAVALGPMTREAAEALLLKLRAQRKIPNDSFISNGSIFRSLIWPVGAEAEAAAAAAAAQAAEPEVIILPGVWVETIPPVVDVETPVVQDETTEVVEAESDEPPTERDLLNAAKALQKSWNRPKLKAIQVSLKWLGDYTSDIDGAFGPGTRKAISAFQTRNGYPATGVLTQIEADDLTAQHAAGVKRLGMHIVRDLDAGIEIVMPGAMVEFTRFRPPYALYGPIDNAKAEVRLISLEGDRAILKELYGTLEASSMVPEEGYRTRKNDWFVLSGKDDRKASYTLVRHKDGLIKGFSLIWATSIDQEMQQVAEAMYESFTPISNYVLDPNTSASGNDGDVVDLLAGLTQTKASSATSGFVVGATGHVVTHADTIGDCRRLSLDDGTELRQVRANADLGLALLEPTSSRTVSSYARFSDNELAIGNDIVLSGYSYPMSVDTSSITYGSLQNTVGLDRTEGQLTLYVMASAGDIGGPILNASGAVVGMYQPRPGNIQIDGIVAPDYVNFAASGASIVLLLQDEGVKYRLSGATDPVEPLDMAAVAADITVRVSCWN